MSIPATVVEAHADSQAALRTLLALLRQDRRRFLRLLRHHPDAATLIQLDREMPASDSHRDDLPTLLFGIAGAGRDTSQSRGGLGEFLRQRGLARRRSRAAAEARLPSPWREIAGMGGRACSTFLERVGHALRDGAWREDAAAAASRRRASLAALAGAWRGLDDRVRDDFRIACGSDLARRLDAAARCVDLPAPTDLPAIVQRSLAGGDDLGEPQPGACHP